MNVPLISSLIFSLVRKLRLVSSFVILVCEERIALQQAVIVGYEDNLPQQYHVRLHCVVAVVLFDFEEQLEIGDERRLLSLSTCFS